MNRHLKLGRISSNEAPTSKKTKNVSPRNPLKDLNLASSSSSTAAAAKSRCFSLLPRSRSPSSAPPLPKYDSSKYHAKSVKAGARSKILKENRDKKPDHKLSSVKNGDLGGKKPDFKLSSVKNGDLGGLRTSTPEKSVFGTPTSNTTPPVQVSISPEIFGGASVAPTPACFAAGHVVAGVSDRRKCRPRGILTIGENKVGDGFRVSLAAAPPLAEASMQWLSSLSEYAKAGTGAEASVNWQLSPLEDGGRNVCKNASMTANSGFDDENWWFSPVDSNTTDSNQFGGLMSLKSPVSERTPLSDNGVWRTPASDTSVSPFSMIVQRAEAWSRCKRLGPYQVRGRHRYDSLIKNSPYLEESGSSSNVIKTSSSNSSSKKREGSSPSEMDSIAKVLGNTSLSPQPAPMNKDVNTHFPLPETSFQFICPATPSNSIDFSHFQKISSNKIFTEVECEPCLDDKRLSGSGLRISWREGLISRIFEMDELDAYQGFSDDEDNVCCNDMVEQKIGHKFDLDTKGCSMLRDESQQNRADAFGSIEFFGDHVGLRKGEAEIACPDISSCAESISTDGGGLISSGDSDWTLFYKNHLFEYWTSAIPPHPCGICW